MLIFCTLGKTLNAVFSIQCNSCWFVFVFCLQTCTKEILSHVSRDCEVFRQVLQEKEEKLKKNVEEMKAKNLEELRDALRSIQEVSSLTEMNTQIITESAPAGNCMIQKVSEGLPANWGEHLRARPINSWEV